MLSNERKFYDKGDLNDMTVANDPLKERNKSTPTQAVSGCLHARGFLTNVTRAAVGLRLERLRFPPLEFPTRLRVARESFGHFRVLAG